MDKSFGSHYFYAHTRGLQLLVASDIQTTACTRSRAGDTKGGVPYIGNWPMEKDPGFLETGLAKPAVYSLYRRRGPQLYCAESGGAHD